MRKLFALLAVVLLVTSTGAAFARGGNNGPAPAAMEPGLIDVPARAPDGFARADTINFGYFTVIGGGYYAVQGQTWTWDHGSSNIYEGWYAVDESANPSAFFKQITASSWASDPNNPLPAPIISGTGTAWLGAFESQARTLCWDAGLGYANDWCQRLIGPNLTYDGSGSVSLSMKYFNDSELNFDYTKVLLRVGATDTPLNGNGFTDRIGAYNTPLTYARDITNQEFGGGTDPVQFSLMFEFTSDGGWSDQDGDWPTAYGPFAADDINLTNNIVEGNKNYNFDANLQGWTAATCVAKGSYFGIASINNYVIQDPCACTLEGNVVEFHDVNLTHPVGQKEGAFSPAADRTNLQSYNQIFADWDCYAEMPKPNGVFFRSGWNYYPFICPSTGASMWSGRDGDDYWRYVGEAPACFRSRNVATDWGIPGNCNLVGFVYEVYSSCDAFGIPSTQCSGVTNFTPIIDNVQIRMTGVPLAPVVSWEPGSFYTDGFGQQVVLSTTAPGNADAVVNLHRGTNNPDMLGDSLVVKGPTINAANMFLCKLWFRIRREGPGNASIPNYTTWKNNVRDNLNIVGPTGQFTYGWMDSLEVGTAVAKNKFISNFKENDDDFVAPDYSDNNEIIRDGILGPGTEIQYFITSAYTCTPTVYYYLPDTTGKFFYDFEILPSYRTVGGVDKFPCVLYLNSTNPTRGQGSRFVIENALNVVLNGAGSGAPIPDPTTWDRYDYLEASSNVQAPMFRDSRGGNAGGSLAELLGYRAMIVCTTNLGTDQLDVRDWQGFGDWLGAVACGSNTNLQGFYGTGDNMANAVATQWPSFLYGFLGATALCDGYNIDGCPSGETDNDELYCTRLDYSAGGPWQPAIPLDVWGNWCPAQFYFDVIGTTGGGVGNKKYHKYGTSTTVNYAQVTNDASNSSGKFRTVIDGYSIHHMAKRDLAHPGSDTECPSDSASVVEAGYNEIRDAIKWTLNLTNPQTLADLCTQPCTQPGDVPGPVSDGAVGNRLYQNSPNPFNPRTSITFSLGQAGPAKLIIYDVNGRKVKTLVDGPQTAGQHTLVWDGTNDMGHKVSAGVFWSQLSVGDYTSNKKMVVLR